jgi:type II secretory pathway pseudopilin PulG
MKNKSGFTVIELILVILVLGFTSILFFVQRNNLESVDHDKQRKVAINAMYYSLEEVYYKSNNSYPEKISSSVLTSLDPSLFKDPNGIDINQTSKTSNGQTATVHSDYSYTAENCQNHKCKKYTLKSKMENEAAYIKHSKNS